MSADPIARGASGPAPGSSTAKPMVSTRKNVPMNSTRYLFMFPASLMAAYAESHCGSHRTLGGSAAKATKGAAKDGCPLPIVSDWSHSVPTTSPRQSALVSPACALRGAPSLQLIDGVLDRGPPPPLGLGHVRFGLGQAWLLPLEGISHMSKRGEVGAARLNLVLFRTGPEARDHDESHDHEADLLHHGQPPPCVLWSP